MAIPELTGTFCAGLAGRIFSRQRGRGRHGAKTMALSSATDTKSLSESIWVERHEGKYVIPPTLMPAIREYIGLFCDPDPNCKGFPPEYVTTTLQLDTPAMSLHHAKESEAVTRFKLRARTYGTDGKSPVFMEIKRKIIGVVVKSRARIPREKWCSELILDPKRLLDVEFRSAKEEYAFLEFVRLTREIGATPKVLVRYTRESYVSRVDDYARVTFDRNLLYQPTHSWDSWGDAGKWRPIDTPFTQDKGNRYSGVILEIKTMSNPPMWVVDLIENFDLARTGNCKYSSAVWTESLFGETPAAAEYATELFLP